MNGGSDVDIDRLRSCEVTFIAIWKEHAAGMRFEVLAAVDVQFAVLRDVDYPASHPGGQQTFRSDSI